jgi:hypothetical protein
MPQIKLIEASVKRFIRKLIKQMGTLNVKDVSELCPKCDLVAKCPEREKLSVYCLEGLFCKR